MQLEDYFEFETFDTKFGPVERISFKGHRIKLENVVELFQEGQQPDQIQREAYPSLTLEQVYAAITYYLHNKQAVDEYNERGEKIADAYYQEWLQQEPPPVVKRLRELRARQEQDGKSGE